MALSKTVVKFTDYTKYIDSQLPFKIRFFTEEASILRKEICFDQLKTSGMWTSNSKVSASTASLIYEDELSILAVLEHSQGCGYSSETGSLETIAYTSTHEEAEPITLTSPSLSNEVELADDIEIPIPLFSPVSDEKKLYLATLSTRKKYRPPNNQNYFWKYAPFGTNEWREQVDHLINTTPYLKSFKVDLKALQNLDEYETDLAPLSILKEVNAYSKSPSIFERKLSITSSSPIIKSFKSFCNKYKPLNKENIPIPLDYQLSIEKE